MLAKSEGSGKEGPARSNKEREDREEKRIKCIKASSSDSGPGYQRGRHSVGTTEQLVIIFAFRDAQKAYKAEPTKKCHKFPYIYISLVVLQQSGSHDSRYASLILYTTDELVILLIYFIQLRPVIDCDYPITHIRYTGFLVHV